MEAAKAEPTNVYHVVAMPYPGRGHVNPMMNLCKQLSSKKPDILISFVVTEEWLGFISSYSKPANVRYATLPNVIPSELDRAKDFPGFVEAVRTNMEDPFERLLDRLEPAPVSAIIADTYLRWICGVGNRRNIPVVSLWTMSATVFSVFHHFHLLVQNRHFPVELPERGDERVEYIPGLPSTRLADLPTIFYGTGRQTVHVALECISLVHKAQYLIFTSFYELEPQVIDALKSIFSFPVYSVGPTIPYHEANDSPYGTNSQNGHNYLQWLDSQPNCSVLYVSLGSFLSVPIAQMDEIIAGIRSSGVRYLWVSIGDTSRFKDDCYGDVDKGIVVPWCDQLRVLCHSSIGGFWSHCGFNSTLEAVYAGVPVLAFPIFWDQVPNSKNIEEDWKIGWRVRRKSGGESLVKREEIAELVKRFMDLDDEEGRQIRQNAKELKKKCQQAIAKGGSTDTNLDAFVKDLLEGHSH